MNINRIKVVLAEKIALTNSLQKVYLLTHHK